MSSERSLRPRPLLWLAVALLGAVAGVALQLAVDGSSESPAVSLIARSESERDAPQVGATLGAAPDAAMTTAAIPSTSEPEDGTTAALVTQPDPADAGQPAAAPAPAPAAEAATPTGPRLRIPALGIDARVVTLGFSTDGQLDVPGDGSSVGWYDISARPGEPGNALLGAHFDWDGSLAVFASLSRLSTGDLVYIDDGTAGELVYEVTAATSVGWDHPVADVLASDSDRSSQTLFTCGGSLSLIHITEPTRHDSGSRLTSSA